MPCAGASAGSDQELVRLAGGDDLLDDGIDRGTAAIDHALSADLDDARVRQDAEVRRLLRCGDQLRVGERALHQQPFQLRGGGRHPRHPLVF
jgi:hypothetical protein